MKDKKFPSHEEILKKIDHIVKSNLDCADVMHARDIIEALAGDLWTYNENLPTCTEYILASEI